MLGVLYGRLCKCRRRGVPCSGYFVAVPLFPHSALLMREDALKRSVAHSPIPTVASRKGKPFPYCNVKGRKRGVLFVTIPISPPLIVFRSLFPLLFLVRENLLKQTHPSPRVVVGSNNCFSAAGRCCCCVH